MVGGGEEVVFCAEGGFPNRDTGEERRGEQRRRGGLKLEEERSRN